MSDSCEFYEPRDGFVIQCQNLQGEGPLFFFVPVAEGCAVRVPVCEEHAEFLHQHHGAA